MESDDASPAFRTRRHLMYAAVITIIAVVAGYNGVLYIFRGDLMNYLGIGDDRFGLLFSIGSITGLASVLFGGALIDRWGPRRVIRICLTGVGCAMFIVAFGGQHFISFAIAAGVSGIFSSSLFIAISAYLAKLFPKHQRRVISLNLASSSLGGMMFPVVAEGLLYLSRRYDAISFGQVLHVPFAFAGASLAAVSFIYRGKQPPAGTGARSEKQPRRWQFRELLLPPRALMLAFLIALHGASDTTLHVWMSRFLESDSFPSEVVAPGIVLSGFALAYLLARGTLATLPDRIGRRAFLVMPGITGGCIVIAGILSRNYMLAAGGYVLGAFCWSVEYPTMVSMLVQHDKKRFGAAMAASGLMSSLMIFAAMNLLGMIIQSIGSGRMWQVMLIPAAGFLLVGFGGLIWITLYGRQTAEAAPVPDTIAAVKD